LGQVVAWGQNTHGQSNVPPDLRGVTAVAAGDGRSLAVRPDGTVLAWGALCTTRRFPSLTGVTAVAAGSRQSLALRSNGGVVAWSHDKIGVTYVPFSTGVTAITAVTTSAWRCLPTGGRRAAREGPFAWRFAASLPPGCV
jgi:alpha-tubulin suppressor-like RCC1 family protein